uniref:Uncharacterized protein n=1 Tax=Kalanchoe fedtschenkoi TaxID=63787 RepID=A0A7N0RGD4_KALFE
MKYLLCFLGKVRRSLLQVLPEHGKAGVYLGEYIVFVSCLFSIILHLLVFVFFVYMPHLSNLCTRSLVS